MAQVHDVRITVGQSGSGPITAEVAIDLVGVAGQAMVSQLYGLRIELVPLGVAPQGYVGPQFLQPVGRSMPMARQLGHGHSGPAQPKPVNVPGFGMGHSTAPTPSGQGLVIEEVVASNGQRRTLRRQLPLQVIEPAAAVETEFEEIYSPSVTGRLRVTPQFRIKHGRSWLSTLGYAQQSIGQQTFIDLLAGESIAEAYQAMARLQVEQTPQSTVLTLKARNGELHPFAVTLRPIRLLTGGVEAELLLEPELESRAHEHREPINPSARANGSAATETTPMEARTSQRSASESDRLREKLASTEGILQSLFNAAPVGICVTTEEGHFESVNPTYCAIYGYSEQELKGKPFTMVVPAAERDRWQQTHRDFLAGATHTRGEFNVVSKDGRRLTILADSALVVGDDGRKRKLTFVLDITARKQAELQLKTSEERLKSMFNTAPVGICVTNAEGVFEQVNDTYTAIYGYRADELLGQHFGIVVEPKDLSKWKAAHDAFVAGRADVRGEFNVVTKSGKRLHILADSTRITGADGQIKKVTYVLDITERKRAEEMLRLSEERNSKLIETAPVGICVTNTEGHFESVNETYTAIYGYSREELLGQHFSLVVPASERPKWVEAHSRFIAGKADVRGEFNVVTKSGKRLTILADSARITGADGQIKKVTYVLDITERKRAEQLLRLSEDRLQSMVNAAPVGICVTNAEGNFEAVNDAYLGIYGYTREELVGQPFSMVVPPNEKQKWMAAHERFIAGQADVRGEFNVITKAGKRLTILADSARIVDNDGSIKKVTYVLDITERKRAEAQLKLSEECNRQLIDSAPVGICVTDEAGVFESVNDTYTQIYGFSREELLGKHFSLVVPALEREKWEQAHNRFMAGQADVRGEFNVVTKHGKRLAILADSIRTVGADGQLRKVTFVVDITDRKQAEQELRAREEEMRQNFEELQATQDHMRAQAAQLELSEQRFRSLIQQAPVGVCVTGTDGTFESVNVTYCEVYGYTVDELIGRPFTIVVPKAKAAWWKKKHDEFLAGRDETRGEFNTLSKDGRELTVLADSLRIAGPDGQPRKVTFVIDITDRKQSEERIRQSEERLNGLINTAPVGICITDEAGTFESVNSTYCTIYGYTEDELVGRPFTTVVPPSKVKQWMTAHDRFIAGQADVRGEFATLTKDGRELTILADSMRMLGPDGNPRKVTFVLDITERKAAEEQLRRQEQELRTNVDQLRKAQELMQLTQKELQLSEALSRSVLESAPVGISIVNHEGAFDTVNDTFCEIYGYSRDEMVGQPQTLVVPSAERTRWQQLNDRFIAGTAELRGEFVTVHKSGRKVVVMTDSARITGLDGLPKKVSFVIDVTRRKEAEAEIRKLSLVASKTDNGIVIVNAKGDIEWANEALARLVSREVAELMSTPATELPLTDASSYLTALKQALAKKSSTAEAAVGRGADARLLALNLTPVLRDSGELEQVVVVLSDITERKRKEEELAAALKEVQSMQDQILISEKMAALGQLIAGVAHEVNTPISAVKASVTNMKAMLPETVAELPPLLAKLPKTQLSLFTKLVQESVTAEVSLSTKEERQVRRQIAELLEQNGVERAEELADNLVEIRVVQNVERFIPLLQSTQANDILSLAYKLGQLKVNLSNIDLASDKTAKVVSALKNYSHVQTSDALVETRVEDSVETILTLYQNQFKHGVQLVRNYDDALPEVPIYPDELGQVWTNIIQNGIQAMKGEGTITIETFRSGDSVAVRIIDSGPGIPEQIMHRIFEPFFTTKGQGEGTGLGLDITRKIVEKHRGTIDVESQPGRTAFTVCIPITGPQG